MQFEGRSKFYLKPEHDYLLDVTGPSILEDGHPDSILLRKLLFAS
jgi:hypothetical protein